MKAQEKEAKVRANNKSVFSDLLAKFIISNRSPICPSRLLSQTFSCQLEAETALHRVLTKVAPITTVQIARIERKRS